MSKFINLRNLVAGAVASVATGATAALAAISAGDEANIMAGISASDAVFFKIGGAILIVMAGIWGFKRVKSLL